MKKLTLISILIVLVGCAQTSLLKNGRSKAPTNPKVFKNRAYFDEEILSRIDTTVIYEKYDNNYYEGTIKQKNVLARLNFNNRNTIYGVYRFYRNGCYSLFHLDRAQPKLTKEMFDPSHTGWRGVLYKKKNKIQGDQFTQVGQLSWQLGKQTNAFTFKGDTLIVELKRKHKNVYIKRRIDPNLLKHQANW